MKKNEINSRSKVSKVVITLAMIVGCGVGILSMTGCGIPGVSAAETDTAMTTTETQMEAETPDTPDTIVNEAPRTTVYEAPRKTVYEGKRTTYNEGSKTTVYDSHDTTVNEAPRTNVTVAPETTVNEPQQVTPSNTTENNDIEAADNEEGQAVSEAEDNDTSMDEVISALIGVWIPETIDEYSEACHFGYLGSGGISSSGGVFGVNTFLVIPDECGSCGGASAMSTSLEGNTLICSPIQDAYAAGASVGELNIDISEIDNDVIVINGAEYIKYSSDPSERDYQE